MNIKELYPQAYSNIDVCINDPLLEKSNEWFKQLSILDQTNAIIDHLDNFKAGVRPELLNEYEICHIYKEFMLTQYNNLGYQPDS